MTDDSNIIDTYEYSGASQGNNLKFTLFKNL